MSLNISQALELIHLSHQKNTLDRSPHALYDPRDYMMSMGGKKLRSLFCLLGYQVYKSDISSALDLAYIIELFHNFTLVHDDIMDDAPLRRGRASVHSKYGTNEAILSGDVMIIEVYDRLLRMECDDRAGMMSAFSQTAREVCEGQSMDMSFETSVQVSISEYLKMIELKTAVLLGRAFQLGAKHADASESDQEHLYKFAVNAGISFQLQDDYLDVYGDPDKFGKKVGGDIIQGKKTYLYLRAVALLEGEERDHFIELYGSNNLNQEEKVSKVRLVFDELFLSHYCKEAKEAYYSLSKSHLDMVSINDEIKRELLNFTYELMNRQS